MAKSAATALPYANRFMAFEGDLCKEGTSRGGTERVLRSGSWQEAKADFPAFAWRLSARPATADVTVGFRLTLGNE